MRWHADYHHGQYHGSEELEAIVDSSLSGWIEQLRFQYISYQD